MQEQSYLTTMSAYLGQERRLQERRTPMDLEDRDWRILNLALVGSEQRGSFGRRNSDYAILAGAFS
ncbi:hypothetical protein FNU76_07450 [Chitinimonas arctica]|uniref:Uncharacterized protein n=1 Tax=Chitinimonas arctica TaxID=2594795 RepID=A0A516SDI2_9NEIS|nr:hypothetical protein [Chitinimonas arctica]QDQ26206.1 hypothetical protein FNU76_07450 [Chitinimonas arctica]